MNAANEDLRGTLIRHEQAAAGAVARVLALPIGAEAVAALEAAPMRGELSDALDRFERARHEARVAMFAYLGSVPGVTTADIGRAFGVSRQLAARLAQEAKVP